MATGFERIIGLNTPAFFVKDSFANAPQSSSSRRVIMLRTLPGIGRFPTIDELTGAGLGQNGARILSLNGVPNVGDVKGYD